MKSRVFTQAGVWTRASTSLEIESPLLQTDLDLAEETVEEFQATSLDQDGQSRDTTGRRARRHGMVERADRDSMDLPDEPPPGWPTGRA